MHGAISVMGSWSKMREEEDNSGLVDLSAPHVYDGYAAGKKRRKGDNCREPVEVIYILWITTGNVLCLESNTSHWL